MDRDYYAMMSRWNATFRLLLGYEWAPAFLLLLVLGVVAMLVVYNARAKVRQLKG